MAITVNLHRITEILCKSYMPGGFDAVELRDTGGGLVNLFLPHNTGQAVADAISAALTPKAAPDAQADAQADEVSV